MVDFSNPGGNITDRATGGRADINTGTTGSMRDSDFGLDDVWSSHDQHLRDSYATRSYARADRPYEYYQPAYRYGVTSASQHTGRGYSDVENDLERGWDKARGASTAAWNDVKDAVRDGWEHLRGHETNDVSRRTIR